MSRRYYYKGKRYSGYKSYSGKRRNYSTNRVSSGDDFPILNGLAKGIIGLFMMLAKGICRLCQFISQTIDAKYIQFVKEHSTAIKALHDLNEKYTFLSIPDFDIYHSYDNENFYDSISPQDYLTYQLVYQKKEILSAISDADENCEPYRSYREEVSQIQRFSVYDVEKIPKNKTKLLKMEERIFNEILKHPITSFSITVQITLTNIKGRVKENKYGTFNADMIRSLITRLENKDGDFYLDKEIWDSICNVERGKVTNKVRFAVYQKYNHRCAKCGSPYDLEVDHIFPIAKGGKSNFENLQVLCHSCNALKSDTVEEGAINPKKANRMCPHCHTPLLLKKGKYGDFYGCPNYPNCKYTEKLR